MTHPPLVPPVLRVGVTGHRPDPAKRPDPDVPAIRAVIADVLGLIGEAATRAVAHRADLFAAPLKREAGQTPRIVRVVSALAAGPDQWLAADAVTRGCDLQCVLPFARDEYRLDFDRGTGQIEDPDAEYIRLLGRASAVFEMDGVVARTPEGIRRPDSSSYLAAGRAILRQSDLLVAIWDGQRAQGIGGTGQIVAEALKRGLPVVWIPWSDPGAWRVLLPEGASAAGRTGSTPDRADLPRLIAESMLPPDELDGDSKATAERREYFSETQKRGNPLYGCWALFAALVCGRFVRAGWWRDLLMLRMFRVGPFLDEARARADRKWTTRQSAAGQPLTHVLDGRVRQSVDQGFVPHFAWASGLSVYYGQLHRGAFLVNALLAATAVFLALVSVAAGLRGDGQSPWILAELVVILAILGLTRLELRQRWHQRWIDYRILAERLRLSRCASLLGGGGPLVMPAGHQATFGNPLRTWMQWHARAIERAAGLPGVQVTDGYLAGCKEFWVESLVEDQRRYHEQVAGTFAVLDRRLHRAGDAFFALTLVACLVHVGHVAFAGAPPFAWVPPWMPGWFTLLCAFLPAAGAACAAIRGFAETRRISQRSRAMADELAKLRDECAGVPVSGNSLNLQRLRECADRVSDLMIQETFDWRVVFLSRPPALPA
jgi:hypothetical protein